MSLRDFNNTPASDDPIALHNEPMGNGGGLSTFHTTHPEEREANRTPQIAGAVAVALLVGVAAVGLYAYSGPSHHSQLVVADNSLPKSAPVAPPPAAAPANTMTAAPNAAAPDAAAPMPASAPEVTKPAPVRTASIRSTRSASTEATANARMSASIKQAAPEAAQTTPVPEQAQATPLPAAPSPSPSDVASNTPAVSPVEVSPAPQQLQSSTPQADNAAPAQDQQSGATPAPAPAQ